MIEDICANIPPISKLTYPPKKKKRALTTEKIKENKEIWLGIIFVFERYLEILVEISRFKCLDTGPSEIFFNSAKRIFSAFLNAFSSSTSIQYCPSMSKTLALSFLTNIFIPAEREVFSLAELSSKASNITGEQRKIPVS
jgi:hypothetical protein